jgi:hypothetical protein
LLLEVTRRRYAGRVIFCALLLCEQRDGILDHLQREFFLVDRERFVPPAAGGAKSVRADADAIS